jgi:glycosyltransferase involved in cell wall biosynthesis
MLAHFFHLFDAQTTLLPHAADALRLTGQEAAARPRLISAVASVGRDVLRLPLALPNALRDFLLAWLATAPLHFAPQRRARKLPRNAASRGERVSLQPAWIGDPEAPPRIYLDLSDVLCHAVWHDTCAGIPRVQLEIAGRLHRANPAVCIFGLHAGKWCDLGPLIEAAEGDVDRIFALLKESFTDFSLRVTGLKLFVKRRRRHLSIPRHAQAPDLRPRDHLFIGGAFWLNREIIALCEKSAANGADLIILFHDLIPLSTPSFTGHDFIAEYEAALRLPAHFIVTTELNRDALKQARRRLDAGAGRTCSTVMPLADEYPGSKRGEMPGAPSPRLEMLAGGAFALCVGTIEIRKNHHSLLRAWAELAEESGGIMPRLVIAGRRGWKAAATLAELDALSPGGSAVFIEAPTDDELRWLYAACLFTVFPSFFEGWGLPVGESFWFGKPCAASNAPSIAPVARDLCAFFSPHHTEDMKDAIRRLLDPHQRETYRRRIEKAPLRTWSEVALDVERVIAERRPPSDAIASEGDASTLTQTRGGSAGRAGSGESSPDESAGGGQGGSTAFELIRP